MKKNTKLFLSTLILSFLLHFGLNAQKSASEKYNYYYEKSSGDRLLVNYMSNNFKTYFVGILDKSKNSMDTVFINTNNKMQSPQHYSVFDSYLEGNKMVRLSKFINIAIIEDWAIKRDSVWEHYAISIGPEWNLDKISKVKILDIEHVRVIADGKTTIYTIDYEKNTCSSDDEKK